MSVRHLAFMWLTLFVFLVMTSRTLSIESLDESERSESVEDLEEGFAATLLAKDVILKRNPAGTGNKLKDLWEKVPDIEVEGANIKK